MVWMKTSWLIFQAISGESYYPRNTVIYSENSPPDAFFIVFNGKVRVSKSAKKGEYLVNILGPGDYFGEQAFSI